MTLTYRCLVSGRVQGVGYRRFAQKRAEELGIQGWTRNLTDGRVEVCAQAEVRSLNLFIEKLTQGPPFGRVDDVQITKIDDEVFLGFEIRADGVEK